MRYSHSARTDDAVPSHQDAKHSEKRRRNPPAFQGALKPPNVLDRSAEYGLIRTVVSGHVDLGRVNTLDINGDNFRPDGAATIHQLWARRTFDYQIQTASRFLLGKARRRRPKMDANASRRPQRRSCAAPLGRYFERGIQDFPERQFLRPYARPADICPANAWKDVEKPRRSWLPP